MPLAGSLRAVGAPVHVFFRSCRVKSELRLQKSMKNEGHGGPHLESSVIISKHGLHEDYDRY